jgi:capsular exopolysaccharide synthesis family protein
MDTNTKATEKDGETRGAFHTPESTLKDYLRVVTTRYWLVASTFLVVVVAAGVYVFTRTPIYRSRALLQIEPAEASVVPYRGVYDRAAYASSGKHSFIETQMKLIVAERIVEQTFRHFGLGDRPEFRENPNPVRSFQSLFTVAAVRRTWLVEVTFDWPEPELGARILSYHVNRYVDDYAERKHRMATEGLENLRKQREKYEARVKEARERLQRFKEQHNMIAFDKEHDTVSEGLMARTKAVEEARQQLAVVASRLEQIEAAVRDQIPYDNLPEVLRSPLIRDYRNEKARCEQDLREGLKRFGENHPEIKTLRAKLESIDENIQLEIQRIFQASRAGKNAAERLLALRQQELETYEQKVHEFNKLNVQYQRLKTDFETPNQIYKEVLKRIDQIEITMASHVKGETVSVVREPKREVAPAKPRKALILGLAGMIGLTLGVGLAFLLDNLDTSLKSKEDVARYLGLSLLGYVPEVSELRGAKRAHSRVALPMVRHPRAPAAEAFRSVRTALSFSVAAQDVNHIMVTSASPSEGKTLVSVNIAAAFAQAGKRVLLVDADMRKPAVHKVLEAEQTPGLTNLLVGEGATELRDVARPSEIPNLFFIPVGPIPPNPAELMGCDRMEALLNNMQSEYDQVIIDTPPVVNVTDAAVLCHSARGVVLVVRSFRTQRELARRAVEVLAESGGKLLGVVLNNIDVPRGAYYYDTYYYYQQYYYDTEGGKKKRKKRRRRDHDSHKATA